MTPPPTELKLLPCPFCGAPQEDVDGEMGTRHKEWCYFIVWEHELPGAPNRIMAWNTRTPQPIQDAIKAASEGIRRYIWANPYIDTFTIEQILTKHLNPKTR